MKSSDIKYNVFMGILLLFLCESLMILGVWIISICTGITGVISLIIAMEQQLKKNSEPKVVTSRVMGGK